MATRTGLFVGWFTFDDELDGQSKEGWCVAVHQGASCGRGIVAGRYASRRDAEIGLASFRQCDIDWSQRPEKIREQLIKAGGQPFVDRVAYENLPW